MKRQHLSIALALCLAGCASLYARTAKTQTITAEQARNHVGETATVCGRVASTHYAPRSRGRATFLNLDHPYPHQVFTVVIWGTKRARFGRPEEQYRNKNICVTGFISVYHGQPDMTLRSPKQIKVK
ncbi:MAG: DNA-binding protein [Acidobacteriota bacterium]